MKRIIVTATIFIILTTVLTLYLDREHKRFVENLRKPLTTVTPPIDPEAAATFSENGETAADLGQPEPIIENTSTEREHPHPHPHADTLESAAEIKVPFEEMPSEQGTDESQGVSFEAALLEDRDMSKVELEKRMKATDTLDQMVMDPKNWVRGKPGEVGFMFALPKAESEEFLRANFFLRPTEENRKALENSRRPQAQKATDIGHEDQEVIQFGDYTLYLPRR